MSGLGRTWQRGPDAGLLQPAMGVHTMLAAAVPIRAFWGDSMSAVKRQVHSMWNFGTLFSTDTRGVQGRWNITAGQNSLFDTFDCQVHDFDSPKPNFLHGQLRWRIQKSNGDFISRAGEQTFNQACPHVLRVWDGAGCAVAAMQPMPEHLPALCMTLGARPCPLPVTCSSPGGKQQRLAAACTFRWLHLAAHRRLQRLLAADVHGWLAGPQAAVSLCMDKDLGVYCQDPDKPAYLRNDHNEFLNYTDDWSAPCWAAAYCFCSCLACMQQRGGTLLHLHQPC